MSSTMTIRLGGGIKNRLDQLASVTQRSKSFLAAETIAAYVDTNEWQLAEIQAALSQPRDAMQPFSWLRCSTNFSHISKSRAMT